MATQAAAGRRVSHEFESLRLMIGDLVEVAAEWHELSGAERASWSLDLDQVMGSLDVVLNPAYRTGAMTSDQQGQYRSLLSQLRHRVPTLECLGLQRPSVPLEP